MASKMSCHCGVVIVFNVKYVTLEPVYDSISSLSYIFYLASVALYTINKIIVLAGAIFHCVVGFVIKYVLYFP